MCGLLLRAVPCKAHTQIEQTLWRRGGEAAAGGSLREEREKERESGGGKKNSCCAECRRRKAKEQIECVRRSPCETWDAYARACVWLVCLFVSHARAVSEAKYI